MPQADCSEKRSQDAASMADN
ncbi:hypothetical protein DFAR_830004 [Desulfarculales bacterium]